MTIDVEDYFEARAFEGRVNRSSGMILEPRLKRNLNHILEILEESGSNKKATFFILGKNAKKYRGMVKKIHSKGHEVACHGQEHKSIYNISTAKFREHVRTAKAVLEDVTGEPVLGFRAPNFSIRKDTLWTLKVLWEEGFLYDSSIFPVLHHSYGIPDAPRRPFYVPFINGDFSFLQKPEYLNFDKVEKNMLVEFPLTTFNILGRNIAVAGGGYLRVYPYSLTRWGIKRANSEGIPLIVYLHSWEIDSGQPRIAKIPLLSRFRHYTNLDKTEFRLRRILKDFDFDSFKRRWFEMEQDADANTTKLSRF